MTFEEDLDTFINNIKTELEGDPDPAFLDLIKRQATIVFQPVYQKKIITVNFTGKQKKKTPSGYNLFMEEYAINNPGTKHILTATPEAWRALDDTEKQTYLERASQLKKDRKEIEEAIPKDLPKPQEKPKRPSNCYQLFVGENHTKGDGKTMQDIANMWHELNEAGQQPYKDRAKLLREEHLAKLAAARADEEHAPLEVEH